jgi:hypothetical protein
MSLVLQYTIRSQRRENILLSRWRQSYALSFLSFRTSSELPTRVPAKGPSQDYTHSLVPHRSPSRRLRNCITHHFSPTANLHATLITVPVRKQMTEAPRSPPLQHIVRIKHTRLQQHVHSKYTDSATPWSGQAQQSA